MKIILTLVSLFSIFSFAVDPANLKEQLADKGLQGRIHGVIPSLSLYILTWRNPNDFFDYYEFPLVTRDKDLIATLNTLKRHDLIKVKGSFIENNAPLQHISVKAIEIVKREPRQEGEETVEFEYPKGLEKEKRIEALVHAVIANGKGLFVEWNHSLFPLVVTRSKEAEGLYRGDLVEVDIEVAEHPGRPKHLKTTDAEKSIRVTNSIREVHKKELNLKGRLVRFPKSPVINTDVYAIEQCVTKDLCRYFTLINSEGRPIHGKLEAEFTQNTKQTIRVRNKMVLKSPLLTVKGVGNLVSRNQANPQLFVENVEDLVFVP